MMLVAALKPQNAVVIAGASRVCDPAATKKRVPPLLAACANDFARLGAKP